MQARRAAVADDAAHVEFIDRMLRKLPRQPAELLPTLEFVEWLVAPDSCKPRA